MNKANILNFVGFGNPDAKVVIIGMEEGLKRDVDLLSELAARSEYKQYVDLFDARGEGSEKRYFAGRLILQRTWGPMCRVMLARDGADYTCLDAAKEYQATRLGRRNGDGLLAEVLPLPSSSTREEDWRYREFFPEYASRADYETKELKNRIEILNTHFKEHSPDLVICYGKGRWPEFKSLFPEIEWSPSGVFAIGRDDYKRVVLSPHFVSRQMNGQMATLVALAIR